MGIGVEIRSIQWTICIVKTALEWNPQEKRKRDAPHKYGENQGVGKSCNEVKALGAYKHDGLYAPLRSS